MRISPRALLLLCAAIVIFAGTQARGQIGIYGAFSASDFNLANTGWQYGTTFGIYDDHWKVPFLALGLDGRGSVAGSGATKITSGLAGPRLRFKPPLLPFRPYVEALGGAGHITIGQGTARTDVTKVEYEFLGGADFTIFPRIDWRVVEFSYGGFSGQNLNPRTVSSGLVLRLPF